MSAVKIAAIVLIVAGALGLAFGTFKINRETHRATVGPMEMTVTEQRAVNIPLWAGLGTIAVGTVLLLARRKIAA